MSIVLMPIPKQQFIGTNGAPLAGGKVYTYSPGTTTAKATYTTSAGTTANANPVILDAAGRASIWLNGYYKVSLYDANDVLQYTIDNVSGEPSSPSSPLVYANEYDSLNDAITSIGSTNTNLVVSDNQTLSANLTIPANVRLEVLRTGIIADGGYTLTINGSFSAGLYQVFSGAGSVVFGAGAVSEVYPEWWGAAGDGTTDDTAAIQAAITATPVGGRLYIRNTSNYYKITATQLSEALLVDHKITIVLDGELRGTSHANQADPPFIMNVTGSGVKIVGSGILRGDGSFVGTESTHDNEPGLLRVTGTDVTVEGISFVNPPELAIHLRGAHRAKINKCKFTGGPTTSTADEGYLFYVLLTQGASYVSITDNDFYADSDGGALRVGVCNSSAVAVYGLDVSHNRFTDLFSHSTYCHVFNGTCTGNIVRFTGAYPTHDGMGMKFSGKHCVIANNTISGAILGGIGVVGGADIQVISNNIYDCGSKGISVYNNTGMFWASDNIEIAHNHIEASATGSPTNAIFFYANPAFGTVYPTHGLKIIDNTCVGFGETEGGNDTASIAVIGGGSGYEIIAPDISGNTVTGSNNKGMYLYYVLDGTIEKNIMYDNPMDGFDGIYALYSSGLQVSHNLFYDNQATPTLDLAFAHDENSSDIFLSYNRCFDSSDANPFSLNITYNVRGRGNRISRTDNITGYFTMNNESSKVISNTNSYAQSVDDIGAVIITPLNSAAAQAEGSVKKLYKSATTAGESFTMRTSDGNAVPASDHIYAYELVQ